MPVVKIFAFLDLEKNLTFFKGLSISLESLNPRPLEPFMDHYKPHHGQYFSTQFCFYVSDLFIVCSEGTSKPGSSAEKPLNAGSAPFFIAFL
jgi:hypothetical protein